MIKKESKTYDLIKNLNFAKISNFQFDESKDLLFHSKKNTSRYSVFPEKRFLNSQITFNTNKDLFINQSKDSIMLSPNSSIEFEVEKDVYSLEFAIGILSNKNEKAGRFVIEIDGKLDEENSILIERTEAWTNISKIIRIDKKIKFIWNSNDTFLFLGHPLLTPVNQKKQHPNIILIVVDAMRYDSLSQNGNQFLTTPNIDSISNESIVFNQNFTNANWTKPSMISMFYSEFASNLGLGNTGFEVSPEQKKIFYSSKYQGIVNFVREKKFYTASIMNNVFLLDYTGIGIDLGFHEIVQIGKDIDDTEKITESTIKFLDKDFQNSFFLHINYNTPHGPYTPPKKYLDSLEKNSTVENWKSTNPIIRKYLAEVHFADEQIGIITKKLKEKKIYDDTIIIISSDHGELFSDHHTALVNGINGIKYGHGVTHYEEELHVPLIIKPHIKIKDQIINSKINFQTSSISLFPTILGLSNIDKTGFNFRGLDLSGNIFGENDLKEKILYSEGRLSESIRFENKKYIRRYPFYTNSELSGRVLQGKELEEIYDLKTDPDEKINLISDKELLKKSRENLYNHSLELNSFHLFFPKSKKNYTGKLFVSGQIYNVSSSPNVLVEIDSKRTLQFKIPPSKEDKEIIIKTVKPDLNYDLIVFQDAELTPYRLGKWGVVNKQNSRESEKFLISKIKPDGLENSTLPWIYNDYKISQTKTIESNYIMAGEVRQILKSWGYIHE